VARVPIWRAARIVLEHQIEELGHAVEIFFIGLDEAVQIEYGSICVLLHARGSTVLRLCEEFAFGILCDAVRPFPRQDTHGRLHGVGGHRNDWHVLARLRFIPPDYPSRSKSVHDRHLAIHKDNILFVLGKLIDGLLTVIARHRFVPEFRKLFHRKGLIDGMVLGKQDYGWLCGR